MWVLVIASDVAGAGKTMLATNLAAAAQLSEAVPAAVVALESAEIADPKAADIVAEWCIKNEIRHLRHDIVNQESLFARLQELADDGIQVAFIDTPTGHSGDLGPIASHAHVIMIVNTPDEEAAAELRGTLRNLDCFGTPIVFGINKVDAEAGLPGDVALKLAQFGTIAPPMISDCQVLQKPLADGASIFDLAPNSRAADEWRALWAYLFDGLKSMHLDELNPDQEADSPALELEAGGEPEVPSEAEVQPYEDDLDADIMLAEQVLGERDFLRKQVLHLSASLDKMSAALAEAEGNRAEDMRRMTTLLQQSQDQLKDLGREMKALPNFDKAAVAAELAADIEEQIKPVLILMQQVLREVYKRG